MPISSDNSHTCAEVSSSESGTNISAPDDLGLRNEERDRAATITLLVKTWENAPRKATHPPKGVCEVTDIDLKSWDPTKSDKAHMRFKSVCGFVGGAMLNVNLPGFQKADIET
ncbi:hypothetical protein D1007_13875 [Hordeum vulgare]|nr:hypothetical protein D1007_13875 [Hordeum vulgare]